MYCKHCGKQIDGGSFCSHCGKSLSDNTPSTTDKSAKGGAKSAPALSKTAYLIIGILGMIPYPFAEYRRIVEGQFDVAYWLLSAFLIVTVYCLYKVIASDAIAEEKQKIKEAQEKMESYDDKISNIRTNTLSICCLVVAVFAFLCAGLIRMIF